MQIGIFKTADEVADVAIKELIDVLSVADVKTLGVATGSTPLALYARIRDAHAAGTFSLTDFKAFALDEYVGIAEDHPEGYRKVLSRELVGDDKTGLTEENLNFRRRS